MPRDGFQPVPDPTAERFRAAHNDLFAKWSAAQHRIMAAKEIIAAQEIAITADEAEMNDCVEKANKLDEAAKLLGVFDLLDESQKEPMVAADQDAEELSIKDYVLAHAMAAHPGPTRASVIRDEVRALGHDIHDKTIGMSLYRWSQKGVLRREGKADWYYIPPDERAPGSVQDAFNDAP